VERPKTFRREAEEPMLKNNAESKQHKPQLERHDAMALRERAAEDARKDADSFASKTCPQDDETGTSTGLGLITELFCPRHKQAGEGSRDGIDGLLTHSVGGTTSDELLEIYLVAKMELLAAESIRIFRDNIFWAGKYVDWMKQVQ
jgi:hypothetical protein